ncbi:phage tail assembly chaperone [Comamonas sp. MYb69]|uniref:phage tail assembly chaperone n=1 Tax=Comamonas sp. MYb69 TaxID=1848650 RepID=UPI0030AB9D43
MAKQKTVPVTSLKLMAGKLPTFPLTVTVKNLDGDEFPIVFTAKAQKKSEWAAIRDAHRKTVDGEDSPAEKAEFSFEDLVKDGMRHAAETVAGAVSGWNLEDEFTVDSLIVLEDQCGGSLAKVLNKYDAALFTGQLGN